MSTCGRTALLESVVTREAPLALAHELRAHAAQCPRCRHELNWLETETKLFRERAAREEVGTLWEGVVRRKAPAPRQWSRVLVGLAASSLLLLGAGRLALSAGSSSGGTVATASSEALETSEAWMSPATTLSEGDNCSRLPDGVGFRCEPVIPASFLASR